MPDYTIVNLLELDDSVAAASRASRAGSAASTWTRGTSAPATGRYAPNLRSPGAHRHREQEEAYVVVAGGGRVRLDDEIRELRRWDVVRVAPAVVRAFEAGPEGLELIAVGGPKPEGGDGQSDDSPWPDATEPAHSLVASATRGPARSRSLNGTGRPREGGRCASRSGPLEEPSGPALESAGDRLGRRASHLGGLALCGCPRVRWKP